MILRPLVKVFCRVAVGVAELLSMSVGVGVGFLVGDLLAVCVDALVSVIDKSGVVVTVLL